MITLEGTGLSPGRVDGAVVTVPFAERPRLHSDDGGDASARFAEARLRAEADLRRAIEQLPAGNESAKQILAAHLALVADPLLIAEVRFCIAQHQLTALEALDRTAVALASRFEALSDPTLRTRAHDVRDVCDGIARHLVVMPEAEPAAREFAIICARDLTPAQVLRLARMRPRGFVLEEGSETSHSSILIRALGVPSVIRVTQATTALRDGDIVVVDGDRGRVIAGSTLSASVAAAAFVSVSAPAADPHPAVTRDGVTLAITATIGGAADAQRAMAAGADGVGLFRTEALFLESDCLPSEEVQVAAYQEVFTAVGSRPVTVRIVDLGGDKQPTALVWPREPNPALGLRGVRVSLVHPDVFVTQLRALIRAARRRPLRLLVPMVVDIGDVEFIRQMVADAARDAPTVPGVEIGAMIETPAAALMVEELAAVSDFLSIGTNDLAQYVLAADRGNESAAPRPEALHPAVIRLIRAVVSAAARRQTPVAICGESAADALAIPVFVGMGVTELSVHPSAIPRVKAHIRRLSADAARVLVEEVSALPTAAAVVARIKAVQEADPHAREAGHAR